MTDIYGATPSNIASRLLEARAASRASPGVNLPMLIRALTYREEPLETVRRQGAFRRHRRRDAHAGEGLRTSPDAEAGRRPS